MDLRNASLWSTLRLRGRRAIRRLADLQLLAPLALVIISISVVVVWLGGASYLYFVDDIWPFNPRRDLVAYAQSWNSLFNSGSPNPDTLTLLPVFYFAYALSSIGVSSASAELAYLCLTMSAGVLGVYFSSRLILGGGKVGLLCSTTASALYLLNPVTIMVVIPDGIPLGPLLFAAVPWAYFLTRVTLTRLGDPRRRDWFLPSILMIVTYAGIISVNEPSGANLFPIVLTIPIVAFPWNRARPWVASARIQLRFVALLGGSIAVALLLNAWWLIPEYAYVFPAPLLHLSPANPSFFQLGLSRSIWSNATFSATLFGVLLLAGFPNWGWQSINALYLGTTAWEAVGIILPAVAFLGGFLTEGRQKREWLYHAVIVLGLVLIISGVNSPASGLLAQIVASPIPSTLFRYPWYSFYAVFVLYYVLLFGIGLQSVANRLTSRWSFVQNSTNPIQRRRRLAPKAPEQLRNVAIAVVAAGLLLLIVVYPYPAWNGDLIPSQPASGRVTVPSYVYQTAQFLDANSRGFTVLVLPSSGIACQELSNWSQGYVGASILGLDSGIPVIYNSCAYPPSGLVQEAYDMTYSNLSNTNYSELLSALNVKYIVDRFDDGGPISYYPPPNPAQVAWFLRNQPGIAYIATFGEYELFENEQVLPSVFASDAIVAESGLNYSTNVTSEFYNRSVASLGPGGQGTLSPNWTGGIIDYRFQDNNYTGGPLVAMNSVPLGINAAVFPSLTVDLDSVTPLNISFMASSYPVTSGDANFWGVMIPLNPISPYSPLPGSGNYLIYTVQGNERFTFDLSHLRDSDSLYPLGVPLTNLSYLALVVWQTSDGVPASWSTGISIAFSVEIQSITIGGASFPFSKSNVVQPREDYPYGARSVNLSAIFFGNRTDVNSTGGTLNWTSGTGGSEIGTYDASSNYYAVSMNSRPLNINTSVFPYLVINATVSPNTSMVIMASSSNSLNFTDIWSGDPVPLVAANSLVQPVGTRWPYYYTPKGSIPLTFDLSFLRVTDSDYPSSSSLGTLRFLAIVLVPLSNGTPISGSVPSGIIPTVDIHSFELFSPVFTVSPLGLSENERVTFVNPLTTVYVPTNSTPVEPLVVPTLSDISSNAEGTYSLHLLLQRQGPVLLTLTENFATLWELCINGRCDPAGVGHTIGDGYANSWYVPTGLFTPNQSYIITLYYAGEIATTVGSTLSLVTGGLLTSAALIGVGLRIRRSRRSRLPISFE